jgi:hypothetical protein
MKFENRLGTFLYTDQYPLLAAYIIFNPHMTISTTEKSLVNLAHIKMKPTNIYIIRYKDLVYYQKQSHSLWREI